MTERPILFSAPMVRALLSGTKTQTRRIISERDLAKAVVSGGWCAPGEVPRGWLCDQVARHGRPGDRLWVRETFCYSDGHASPKGTVCYRANLPADEATGFTWKPSIFMRRADSRITLEITEVRAQRLQDISADDAKAEGFDGSVFDAVQWYATLWDQINGAGSWASNPWVWAISFRRLP